MIWYKFVDGPFQSLRLKLEYNYNIRKIRLNSECLKCFLLINNIKSKH